MLVYRWTIIPHWRQLTRQHSTRLFLVQKIGNHVPVCCRSRDHRGLLIPQFRWLLLAYEYGGELYVSLVGVGSLDVVQGTVPLEVWDLIKRFVLGGLSCDSAAVPEGVLTTSLSLLSQALGLLVKWSAFFARVIQWMLFCLCGFLVP